jgi:hypothetical protein
LPGVRLRFCQILQPGTIIHPFIRFVSISCWNAHSSILILITLPLSCDYYPLTRCQSIFWLIQQAFQAPIFARELILRAIFPPSRHFFPLVLAKLAQVILSLLVSELLLEEMATLPLALEQELVVGQVAIIILPIPSK